MTLDQFGARPFVGRLVSASMVKELGPVLTALMLAGRVGSGIAAELGSMVVTDQINALRALGTDPIRKLVVPRVLAGFVMAPVLTVIADTVGIARRLDHRGHPAARRVERLLDLGRRRLYIEDVWMGLIKPFFLGFAIVTIGCHVGLRTHGRHAGRRPGDDQRRRRRVGGGARGRLLRHAAADYAAVLMRRMSLADIGAAVEPADAGRAGRACSTTCRWRSTTR